MNKSNQARKTILLSGQSCRAANIAYDHSFNMLKRKRSELKDSDMTIVFDASPNNDEMYFTVSINEASVYKYSKYDSKGLRILDFPTSVTGCVNAKTLEVRMAIFSD